MQLTVNREVLLLALGRTLGVTGKRSNMPVLSNTLIEVTAGDRFSVTATDLDLFTRGEYEGISDDQGVLCVNARDLHEIVKNLSPGNIVLKSSKDSSVLKITQGRSDFNLHTISPTDYPLMPEFGDVAYVRLSSPMLLQLIERTLASVASDDPRTFLNGVNVEPLEGSKVRWVSTDGHRLALADRELDSDLKLAQAVILPKKGMLEIKKLIEEGTKSLEIGFTASNAFVRTETYQIVMRLIQGEFPDYTMVIPASNPRVFKMRRLSFMECLKRVSILSAERNSGVRFTIQPGELIVSAHDPSKGESRDVVEIDYKGDAFSIGFNARYFLDACGTLSGEEVVLEFSDELAPCVLKDPSDSGYLCVIMPIRVN